MANFHKNRIEGGDYPNSFTYLFNEDPNIVGLQPTGFIHTWYKIMTYSSSFFILVFILLSLAPLESSNLRKDLQMGIIFADHMKREYDHNTY